MIINDNILNSLYFLIDELKRSKEYNDVKESLNLLMNDSNSKALIDEFEKAKEFYSYGETKGSLERLKNAKKALYINEFYINYKEKLNIYNELAKEIENRINSHLYKDSTKDVFNLR